MNDIDTGRFDGAPSLSVRRRLAATVAAALLTTGAVTVSVVASHGSDRDTATPATRSPTSPPTAEAIAALPEGQATHCFESADKRYCRKYLADLDRRVPMQAIRREKADTLRVRIDSVMPTARSGPCEYLPGSGGACVIETFPPTAGQVRAALKKAGYPTAVIRTARPDDPAPAGSLVLAVPAGTACVLLFHDADRSLSWTAGRLPDGTCLAP